MTTPPDLQQRFSQQLDRNTERLDSHAALIADLAARMHMTEHQAERLWERLSTIEKHNAARHSEVIGAISELKSDGQVLTTRFEMSNKMAGKILGGVALLLAAGWTAWQLIISVFHFFKGLGA